MSLSRPLVRNVTQRFKVTGSVTSNQGRLAIVPCSAGQQIHPYGVIFTSPIRTNTRHHPCTAVVLSLALPGAPSHPLTLSPSHSVTLSLCHSLSVLPPSPIVCILRSLRQPASFSSRRLTLVYFPHLPSPLYSVLCGLLSTVAVPYDPSASCFRILDTMFFFGSSPPSLF